MSIFIDTFERANGSLGGNWTNESGSPVISGGIVTGTGAFAAVNTTVSDLTRISCEVGVYHTNNSVYDGGPMVKADASGSHGYRCTVDYVSSAYLFRLEGWNGSSWGSLASSAITGPVPPYFRLYIEWDQGNLSATFNGDLTLTATDVYSASYSYAGIFGQSGQQLISDVTIVAGAAPALSASPTVIGNYGTCTDVDLTGTNTAWTSGTPGSPTFTVNHGHISAQTVTDATHATITLCPDDYLGVITITDPSTGATAGVTSTSDPGIVPPTDLCPFNENFVTMANNTGNYYNPSRLMTMDTTIDLLPPMTIPYALSLIYQYMRGIVGAEPPDPESQATIRSIWLAINGGYSMPEQTYEQPTATHLKQDAGYLITNMDELRGDPKKTIPDVLTAISGISAPDLSAVRADIGIDGQSTWTSILEVLVAMRGATPPSLSDLGTMISDLATIAGYTLGDVMDAIAAIPAGGEVDLSPITNKLNLIQPSTSYSLTTLDSDVANLDGDVAAVKTVVDAIKTKVDALPTSTSATPTAPVWPGLDGVTLGLPVALSNGLVVEGPLHGVIVTITSHPQSAGRYIFGDVSSWMNVGGIIFFNDRTDYERAESFGLDSQILTPRTMAVADGCIVRINQGYAGTLRKWTRNP